MKYVYLLGGALLLGILVLLVRQWLIRQVDRRISGYQNDLLNRHVEEVEQMYRQVRGWRHDYRNHIQVMKAHLDAGRYEELDHYLQLLGEDLASVDTVIKTGNVMVDAILNSKLNLAASQEIAVNVKATVPPTLSVESIDICVILGNLMDNAIEACMRLADSQKRFIRVYMAVIRAVLHFCHQSAQRFGERTETI